MVWTLPLTYDIPGEWWRIVASTRTRYILTHTQQCVPPLGHTSYVCFVHLPLQYLHQPSYWTMCRMLTIRTHTSSIWYLSILSSYFIYAVQFCVVLLQYFVVIYALQYERYGKRWYDDSFCFLLMLMSPSIIILNK